MADYDNNERGVLFRNDEKRDGKKDADYRGNATVDGVDYWLDAWINEAKSGGKYMSLKFKAKEQRPQPIQSAPATAGPEFNDDIPF